MRRTLQFGLFGILTLAGASALAAPKQRVTSPWNKWAAISYPAMATVVVSGGKIQSTDQIMSINYGTSPHPQGFRWTSDRATLIATITAHYECEGTQTHSSVGFRTPFDGRDVSASGYSVSKTFADVKLAPAATLQSLCDTQGTWSGYVNGGTRVVRKSIPLKYDFKMVAACKAPAWPTRHPSTVEVYELHTVCETVTFNSFDLAPLTLYWNGAAGDNLSTTQTPPAGYTKVRVQGYLYKTAVPGTVPLKLFYSTQRKDYFSTATAQGEKDAKAAGYSLVGVIGHVFSAPGKGRKPLALHWSSARSDNFTAGTPKGDSDAKAAGYSSVRTEGYIIY